MQKENLLLSAQRKLDPKIVVGGLTPLTTIDYPGELAAVIFLQGCPWRCSYCQNSSLLPSRPESTITWQSVIELLEKRRGLLDAVVFSGGEPTLHTGLAAAIEQIRSMGYKIGLHTAGIYPDHLQKILPLLDWVGMDIKAAKIDYESITGVKGSGARAWKSARLLIDSSVSHEFRTTVHPDMLSEEQLSILIKELTALGAQHYVIQGCVTGHCLDETKRIVSTPSPAPGMVNQYADCFQTFSIRTAE